MPNVYLWATLWCVDTAITETKKPSAFQKLSIYNRLAELTAVVTKAYNRDESDRVFFDYGEDNGEPPIIVSLFVAPEYLFAASSNVHAISETEKNQVVGRLKELTREREHLILVPGTIAWKKPVMRQLSEWQRRDPYTRKRTGPMKTEWRHDRFARRVVGNMRKQYEMMEEQLRRTDYRDRPYPDGNTEALITFRSGQITKNGMELIDAMAMKFDGNSDRCFIARNTAYAFHGGDEVARYQKRENYREVLKDESDGGFVIFEPGGGPDGQGDRFERKGLTFGIEICADHQGGYLRLSGHLPDVHIVVSASVFIAPQYVAVREGSFLVHASSDPDVTGIWSHDGQRVTVERSEPVNHGTLSQSLLRFKI